MTDRSIWRVTKNGVPQENRNKEICDYIMSHHVLFEFDGGSTYLLMKDKRVPLTHFAEGWDNMIRRGSIEVIHTSGGRKLAKMVSVDDLPISKSYEEKLLEICKQGEL
jgi:hypothetical protein